MPYALNTYSAVCWLYLNKTGRHKRKTQLKWPSMCCVCMCEVLCICICCVLRYICISVRVCTVYFWTCIWVLCVHTYTRPYMCVMLYISMHDCACVCVCFCVHVCLCTCLYCACVHVCMCINTHHTNTHVQSRIHSRVGELRKLSFRCFWLILNFLNPTIKD